MERNPKVSILCLTYNHEKFIGQAIESFLSQKTNFDFEIIINDDKSTDGTTDILKKYKRLYPTKIKLVLHEKNQYSEGIRGILIKNLLPLAKGMYIAICEGDDYFIDENKLQIQVDFLDKNHDYAICFHPIKRLNEQNTDFTETISPNIKHLDNIKMQYLLKENFIATSSVMYKNIGYEHITQKNIMPADWYLNLFHARYGKIGYINKVMSVYRKHNGGLWWQPHRRMSKIIKDNHIYMHLFCIEVFKIYKTNIFCILLLLRHCVGLNLLKHNIIKLPKKL